MDLIKGIGGERLQNIGPEVLVGFLGFQVLQIGESIIFIALCMKYKPIGKLLKYRMLPQRWKETYKGFAKTADGTAATSVEAMKSRMPFLRYVVPSRLWNKKGFGRGSGIGFLEGSMIYYMLCPLLIPANLFFVEYSLSRWYFFMFL